jgi:REP element-mobilizing transposase RayT
MDRPAHDRHVTYPRRHLVPPDTTGTFHCVARCVRRAWLCGEDPYTGESFEHRRAWVEERLFELAGIFSVSLLGYAVMSNHLHLVIRVDADAADQWTDDEVAARWTQLFGGSADPQHRSLRMQVLAADPERVAVCRSRLRSLSWFMQCLSGPIARRANREDEVTGRFWEGRFKCQALLDDAAVLAAMAYVDLNPIRAGMTRRLDRSRHTSIARRLRESAQDRSMLSAPLQAMAGLPAQHALPLSVAEYITLVDWTGRQWRPDKRGAIPKNAPSALSQLNVEPDAWMRHVRGVGSGYWRAVGPVEQLLAKAAAMGQCWLKGLSYAMALTA